MPRNIIFFALAIFLFSCSDGGSSGGNISGGGEEEEKPVFAGNPPVIFSEIYTANANYKDEYDKDPGWAEFYNPADTAVNLKGFSLTDNASNALWTFGDAVIPPRSYFIVFLSGRDKPNLESAKDSIDLISNAVGAWTWADSQNEPPGNSTAQHNFSKNAGLSGILVTADNLPSLNWASATIMMVLNDWDTTKSVDISKTNRILLRGYLSKNSKLEIRLAHIGIEDWKAWPAVIKGTGQENDLYSIELPPNSKLPDLENIYGLRFSNVSNSYGTINFSFNSIIAHKEGGNIHASFELKSKGGKLFLLDSLGQIRDSVAYPAETKDLSFAKNFENGAWAFSKPPTPNSANSNESYEGQAQQPSTTGIPSSGYFENELSFTLPPETGAGTIRCDTSGALPSENSTLKSGSALNLTKTTVLRCAQFKSGAYPSEPIMRTYIIGERLPNLPVVSIVANPKDMFDSTTGIYATGPNASKNYPYFGANYWEEAEILVQIDFFESSAKLAWSHPAGLQIFGNYSRANPKKSVAIGFRERYGQKNLKYALFPEHPNVNTFKWFILRNNGGNYGKDYIRDMLMTSLTEGLGIDYQKGRAVIVYYNGEYYGIHNLRERSNGDYFESNYGIDEDNLDLVKGNGDVSRGSDADYQAFMQWLGAKNTLNDSDIEQLRKKIDLDNYTNYLQSEIYFLNKDWPGNNLKRWRTISPPSKWKWFLYDTDFGFGSADDNSVKMLNFVTEANGPDWPNPPHSTLLPRKLLQNGNYKNAFINRFSLLLATYFAPAKVEARIKTLMQAITAEIPLDQKRWNLNANHMNSELATIENFGKNRAAQMQTEIEQFFGLSNSCNLTLSTRGNGKILIHNLPLPGETATFKAYLSVPVTIKAVPNGGKFKGWSDGVKEAERTVVVTKTMELSAEFQ